MSSLSSSASSSSASDATMSQDENSPRSNSANKNTTPTGPVANNGSSGLKPPTNFPNLLLNRNKKPLAAKNAAASQVSSTPANIKRLQVNKWFNSPTDNLFSPCTKKLYKKNVPLQACTLADQFDDGDGTNVEKKSDSGSEVQK